MKISHMFNKKESYIAFFLIFFLLFTSFIFYRVVKFQVRILIFNKKQEPDKIEQRKKDIEKEIERLSQESNFRIFTKIQELLASLRKSWISQANL